MRGLFQINGPLAWGFSVAPKVAGQTQTYSQADTAFQKYSVMSKARLPGKEEFQNKK